MKNVPEVKLGVIAVSRDCFPIELSKRRRVALAKECKAHKVPCARGLRRRAGEQEKE